MQASLAGPKRERSPSPDLARSPEPRTSGVRFVGPIPPSCQKFSQDYSKARKEWAKSEANKLMSKGLKVTRVLVRDDGLSLDWESDFPIDPKTLGSVELRARDPRADSSRHESTPSVLSPSHGDEAVEAEASDLEERAISFLESFMEAFDTDRQALEGAYHADALFSYTLHNPSGVPVNSIAAVFQRSVNANLHRFGSRKQSRDLHKVQLGTNIFRGPSSIVSMLAALGAYAFGVRGKMPTDVHWNVLVLKLGDDRDSQPCVFLSSHGFLSEEGGADSHRLSFDQVFVLRRSDGLGESATRFKGIWPLVAINHQMVVRDLTLRPFTMNEVN